MNYPEYVEVNGKKYKLNTDFRVAIDCEEIARNTTIDDEERVFAIIYKLYGEKGLKDLDNHNKLLELAKIYLGCGKEYQETNEKPDMDFKQDYGLIWASFISDYNGMDIDKENLHWWRFNEMVNGLSCSELGNCCLLNKVRNIRNKKLSEIKDSKERQQVRKLQEMWTLKKQQKTKPTKEQLNNAKEFLNALGYGGD